MMTKTVLLVHVPYQLRGGEEVHVDMLAQAYGRLGVEVVRAPIDNLEPTLSIAMRSLVPTSRLPEIDAIWAESRPSLVHMHNVFPALGPRFLRWAIHRRAPLVMTVHNHRLFCTNGLALRDGETCELCFHRRLPWPALAYNCNDDRAKTAYHAIALAQIRSDDLYRRAVRRFIAPSPYIEAMLSRLGVPPAQRSMMLHPVLAPEEVQPDVVESDVLYVGRLSEEKGVLQLLSAAREMPDLRVLIAGEGPLAAEVSAAAHVLPNVRALGPVAYERVHALIAASRVCVVPSLCRESASMFALEAFFRGRRAVVPALREMSWLASEPFVGVPADARDLAAFCAAVRTALAMPQLSPEQCRTLRARLGMQRFVEDLGQMLSELA